MTLANIKFKNKDNTSSNQALNKVWKKIEKQQIRNEELKTKIEDFYQDFCLLAEEKEANITQSTAKLVHHLTGFLSRKSLSETRRSCLLDWIELEINYIADNPFSRGIDTHEMRLNIHDQLSRVLDDSNMVNEDVDPDDVRDMLEDILEMDVDLTDAELIEMALDPDNLQAYIESILEQNEDDEFAEYENVGKDDPFEDDYIFDDEDPFSGYQSQQNHFEHDEGLEKKLNALFKSSQINKMYKKLAQILHPDKEQNEIKKQDKIDLMQKLSSAKQQNDVFTIFTLYSQYVPEAEINLDGESTAAIIELLYNKLRDLELEHQQIIQPDSPQNMVWRRFGEGSKKQIKANIQAHLETLNEKQKGIEYLINECTNLKLLNRELAARQEIEKIEAFEMFNELMEKHFF
ncbi:hypothetical protein [Catenovulum sediminis]|uniref:J domain-containing protein n=1 Tax=Catenovulum sediminis TaxID=1740262 RepID=A0ABV1RIG2_9ALTE